MPDFGNPVADQITPPNPNQTIQSLSGILGIANAQQQLQLGQQQLQVGAGTAQSAQQQLDERQLYQSALSSGKDPDGNPIKNPDGTLNYPAVSKFANKYLPITGQAVQQGIIQTLDNANNYHSDALKLTNDQRAAVSGVLASGIGEPDTSGVMSRLDTLAQQNPDLAPFVNSTKQSVDSIPPNASPDQRNQILRKGVQALQPAATTAAQQGNQLITSTGPNGGVQVSNINPLSATPVGPVGPEIAQGIPLGERSQLTTNPVSGGLAVVNRGGNGQITGVTNPPTQNVYNPSPGDLEQKPALVAQRQAAQDAYLNAGVAHANNQLVLQNIDNVAATGTAGAPLRNIASALGLNIGPGVDAATAYDLVGKGLERSALQAAQSMGPNTNAGLDAQIKANGSLHYTPDAIKEVTKLNDALTTGVQSYQPGLERAIAANAAAGIFAKRQFDQQWGANFDPNIFKYYNAIKSGDSTEQQAIVKQLGGLNSPGYNAMMKKAQALQQLSNTGSVQ
jgi:hypothetical protein